MSDKPNLSVGRGEKQSVSAGGGLTAKGRKKYNRKTYLNSINATSQSSKGLQPLPKPCMATPTK